MGSPSRTYLHLTPLSHTPLTLTLDFCVTYIPVLPQPIKRLLLLDHRHHRKH